MLGGIVLGFGPLRDAVQGNGPFEEAMVRFVACLLVCLVSAGLLGRLLDNAPSAGAGRADGPGRTGPGDGADRAAATEPGSATAAERISSSNRSAAGGS